MGGRKMFYEVYELIEFFRGYRNSIIWLKNYEQQLMLLNDKLVGKIGGSIIIASEGTSDESYRRSSVNDEINAYVLEHKATHERCLEIVETCQRVVKMMSIEYQPIIEDIYFYGMSYSSASAKYDVNRTYLYEIIKRELAKVISNEEGR